MKKIKLTRGKFAIVDDDKFDELNKFRWYCNAGGYAVRDIERRTNRKVVWMHREVNNTPSGLRTDHINRNPLDNRKENLRSVTGSQNGMNRGLNKNNTSGYRGICWAKDRNKWGARIKIKWKQIYLGYYAEMEDAIKARKKAELKYFNI